MLQADLQPPAPSVCPHPPCSRAKAKTEEATVSTVLSLMCTQQHLPTSATLWTEVPFGRRVQRKTHQQIQAQVGLEGKLKYLQGKLSDQSCPNSFFNSQNRWLRTAQLQAVGCPLSGALLCCPPLLKPAASFRHLKAYAFGNFSAPNHTQRWSPFQRTAVQAMLVPGAGFVQLVVGEAWWCWGGAF